MAILTDTLNLGNSNLVSRVETTPSVEKGVTETRDNTENILNGKIGNLIDSLLKNNGFSIIENESTQESSKKTTFSLIGTNQEKKELIVSYDGKELILEIKDLGYKQIITKEEYPNIYSAIKVVEDRYGSNFYF